MARVRRQKQYELPAWVQDAYEWCLGNKRIVVAFFLAIIIVKLFTQQFATMFKVGLLGVLGAGSQFYRRFHGIPPAIELVTFSTIIVGYAYGTMAAILFAFIVGLAAEMVGASLDAFIVAYLPARIIAAIIASVLFPMDIATVGIIGTLVYNAIAQPLYLLQNDLEMKTKALFYIAANIVWNVLLFKTLGEAVIAFLV